MPLYPEMTAYYLAAKQHNPDQSKQGFSRILININIKSAAFQIS